MQSKRGWLIAFEGIDGAGKTTQVDLLAAALRKDGRNVVATREPTDGPHGARIRGLSSRGTPISLEDELECFIEDRKEHVRERIAPALERGDVVITDRYYFSNVAYQGARGLSPAEILERNEALFPPPTAVVLLEMSARHGLGRVRARGEDLNRAYENEDFLARVAEIYAGIERPYLVRVEATGSAQEVHNAVVRALTPLLEAG
ncbi:MAG TPA: dTMP kinase [Myxococcales bacterium]|nr:dTMP kinase [Myxococcales bacterium]